MKELKRIMQLVKPWIILLASLLTYDVYRRRQAASVLDHRDTTIRRRSLQSQDSGIMVRDLDDRVNPAWDVLKSTLIVGQNSYGPAYGSTLQIDRDLIEIGPYKDRPIMEDVRLHVPINCLITRRYFKDITRWYQEDSHTQIFRMFPGDDNVRNSVEHKPRTEAFSQLGWKRGDGWHEWSGRYTFIKVRGAAVFQLKHNPTYWSIQLVLTDALDGTFNLMFHKLRDNAGATILERDVVGKSFDIVVQDDGTNHKVYVDGLLRIEGEYTERTDQETNHARWGFYSPRSACDRDILILVTGAKLQKMLNDTQGSRQPTASPTELSNGLPTELPSNIPTGRPPILPSDLPTVAPSILPSDFTTVPPSVLPTGLPTASPSVLPTDVSPSVLPTDLPTHIATSSKSSGSILGNLSCKNPAYSCGSVYAGYIMHKLDNNQCKEQCAHFIAFRSFMGWECGSCS